MQVWSAASGYTEMIDSGLAADVELVEGSRLATADRDVDGDADLLVASGAEVLVIFAGSLGSVAETVPAVELLETDVVGFEDYDGDGRPDLQVLSADGTMHSYLGNSPLGGVTPKAWFLPDDFECPEDTIPYFHRGRFADDDRSIFESDIEWLAAREITRGCNPPFEDRFCPEAVVTRGQMAAFLGRALELAGAPNHFVDDDGSVHEADIGALAGAGITKGCNPPTNDEFCPEGPVTRGQMAAFLTRALGLSPSASPFTDDDGSVFESEIAALAAAGITRGCNPPANDEFCPDRPVTRAQMAAFLHRAGSYLP